jgi:hypothetical protein
MSPEELAALVNVLAIAIAKDKNADEIELIAVILPQISSTLRTIILQRERLKPKSETDTVTPVPPSPPVPPIIL